MMMHQRPMTPITLLLLLSTVLVILGENKVAAVFCDGTIDNDCNGMNGTCTDAGLCVVGPDGVNCNATKDNDLCDDIGITSMPMFNVISTELSQVNTSTPVEYQCDFFNTWTAATHPNDFPTGSDHWSPMVIVTHSDGYQMWTPDALATEGVKIVAETGATGTLLKEVEKVGADTGSSSLGEVQHNSDFEEQTINGIMVDESHSLISSISMVAPSPDWFSGFYNFVAAQDGTWFKTFTLQTYPFDAGTDSGETYKAKNTETDPAAPIFRLTKDTVPSSSDVFLSPDGSTVDPVATWDCTMVDGDDPESSTPTSDATGQRSLVLHVLVPMTAAMCMVSFMFV